MILDKYEYGKFEIEIRDYGTSGKIPVFQFCVYYKGIYLWEVLIKTRNTGEARKEFHEKIMKGEST